MALHLDLAFRLLSGKEAMTAREIWAKTPESGRAMLVELAAELVALAESGHSAAPSVVVVSAESAERVIRDLAGRK